MSFQTVLSIVGVAFSAFEMYKRFHTEASSPRAEPKQSDSDRESGEAARAKLRAPTSGAEQRSELGESQAGAKLRAPTRVEPAGETPRSAVSSKIGMA